MKKRNLFQALLALALVLCTVFTLCACPAADPGTPEENPTPDNPTPPDGGDNGTEDGKPVPDLYADGSPVKGGGASLDADSFAMNATAYDESKAEEITANAFFRGVKRGEGKVFKITDGKAMTINRAAGQTYDGEGSILIAPNGVVIDKGRDLTLKNLTIIGSVTITNSEGLTFERVEIVSDATAMTTDTATKAIVMRDCRLSGATALALSAPDTTVVNSCFFFTEKGILDTASGTTVRNCLLKGTGEAIRTTASDSTYRSNTIQMDPTDVGLIVEGNALNVLLALNDITTAQKSIVVGNSRNVSVVLNRGVSIEARNNRNLYLVDNSLGGRLTVADNNYLIADGNTFPADEWNHETVQSGSKNHNGNNLMDVEARPEVGADEALLPHIDKDLFIDMPRKETVKDVFDTTARSIDTYVTEHAATDDYVIIAPGRYEAKGTMYFTANHKDCTIYAYGAYAERTALNGMMMQIQNSVNIVFKGMTVGHEQQSCGQVYVLEKLNGNRLRVVTGAGMLNEFGTTNPKYYSTTGMGAQRMGTFYAYCDTAFKQITSKNDKVLGVDTMIMEVGAAEYNMLAEGDILTCRSVSNGTLIGLSTTRDVVFYDFNFYGTAAAFAYVENYTYTATTYYRVCDTTKSAPIISEELYNAYRALEEKYGVSLEVYKDEEGRFRGSPAHIGSIDATHTTNCAEGSKATFCLFENMCDDATNQNHTPSRLHKVVDNGDGTVTIYYKGLLSAHRVSTKYYEPSIMCADFKVGDRIYIYTSAGQLLADTTALTAAVVEKNLTTTDYGSLQNIPLRSVTIKKEDINTAPLQNYDLNRNDADDKNKVMVDNMSMASNGFIFDNCKFQNIRSRGLLIKSSEGKILNCTFRNIGMSCGAILYEIWWGESGVTENMLVDRNLFDHTGYFANSDLYATISITGLGSSVEEEYLCYRNIVISNNTITRRTTNYAVYVNSAKDVKILNNTFGPFVGNDFGKYPEADDNPYRPLIHINGAMNVEISGNTYPDMDILGIDYVVAERNKNVFGSDVSIDGTVEGDTMIADDV